MDLLLRLPPAAASELGVVLVLEPVAGAAIALEPGVSGLSVTTVAGGPPAGAVGGVVAVPAAGVGPGPGPPKPPNPCPKPEFAFAFGLSAYQ